jgi:hypothetical protein
MPLLSKSQVLELAQIHDEDCEYHNRRLVEKPLSKYTQYPKIPVAYSESLIFYAINDGHLLSEYGPFSKVYLHEKSKKSDISALTYDGMNLAIEVKSTGDQEYVSLGQNDYKADWLFWLRRTGDRCTIIQLASPGTHISWRKESATLNDIKRDWVGDGLSIVTILMSTILLDSEDKNAYNNSTTAS